MVTKEIELTTYEKNHLKGFMSVCSALFYGVISTMITISNKVVLGPVSVENKTTEKLDIFVIIYLPIVLAQIQCIFAVFALLIAAGLGLIVVKIPKQKNTIMLILVLSFVFVGNLMTGLAATKELSLPMFVVLRRLSILITLFLQKWILRIQSNSNIKIAVWAMLLGSFVAACDDLSFNLISYTLILVNDFLTAINGILIKFLTSSRPIEGKDESNKIENKEMNSQSLLFWNSLLSMPLLMTMVLICRQKISSHEEPIPALFIPEKGTFLVFSSISGILLNISIIACTKYNTPLTTTVVGVIKNTFITYIGLIIGNDYRYSLFNFFGINISIVGAFLYVWAATISA